MELVGELRDGTLHSYDGVRQGYIVDDLTRAKVHYYKDDFRKFYDRDGLLVWGSRKVGHDTTSLDYDVRRVKFEVKRHDATSVHRFGTFERWLAVTTDSAPVAS